MTKTMYEDIEQVSSELGISQNDKVMLKMSQADDGLSKTLSLQNGSWNSRTPWFVLDDEPKVMLSLRSLMSIIKEYKEVQKECFELKLEKSIWQNIPVDFNDVWAVAINEVKRQNSSSTTSVTKVDTDKLVQYIKKEHPNLFVDMNEIMKE